MLVRKYTFVLCVYVCGCGVCVYVTRCSLTSKCSHETLDGTAHRSKDEVAIDSRCNGDGESKHYHDHSSCSQVDQNEVEGLLELLVCRCDVQGQTVDGESKTDQEKHVDSKQIELPWIRQVVLRVFKGTPYKPSPVGHGDVEVVSFSAVLHL